MTWLRFHTIDIGHMDQRSTLPETDSKFAPENWWLEDDPASFWGRLGLFSDSGAMLVLRRVSERFSHGHLVTLQLTTLITGWDAGSFDVWFSGAADFQHLREMKPQFAQFVREWVQPTNKLSQKWPKHRGPFGIHLVKQNDWFMEVESGLPKGKVRFYSVRHLFKFQTCCLATEIDSTHTHTCLRCISSCAFLVPIELRK